MEKKDEARFIVTDSDGNFLDLKKLSCRICLHENKVILEVLITETITIQIYVSKLKRMLKRYENGKE